MEDNYFDDNTVRNRMLLREQIEDLRPFDSNEIMIRVAFHIKDDEVNPLVTVCTGG